MRSIGNKLKSECVHSININQSVKSNQIYIVKLQLALLIFSPLIYSVDGDSYRAFEVALVSALFLFLAIPNFVRKKLWVKSGVAYVMSIALLIVLQPLFGVGAGFAYNLQFMVVLLASFVPTLYLSNCNPVGTLGIDLFIAKMLQMLFGICVISLFISSAAGVGEVYTGNGLIKQRAFAWLGDSFSPVMVFFLYYFAFRRNATGVLISAVCLVFIMQAKMAISMAVLGYLVYIFIFGRIIARILLVAGVVFVVSIMPQLFDLLVENAHNFEYSINNRLLSIDAGLAYFQSSPWFGVGANQTFTLLSNGFDMNGLDRFESNLVFYEFTQIHNSIIRVLAELGVFGLLLFIAFCMAIIRQCYTVLIYTHESKRDNFYALSMGCSLWLISFILFYQTTGWFEPGNPQLSWLICFLTLMNFSQLQTSRMLSRFKTDIC